MHKAITLPPQDEAHQAAIGENLDSTEYWAKPAFQRSQQGFFGPSLDDRIPLNHIVRLLDEILQALDWSAWEQTYERRRGQPPIHPRVIASVVIYGLLRRIRSSRQLEYMCNHSLDFLWLTEGRAIDHTTLCKFRLRFQQEIKELFRQICRLAKGMGLIRLGEIMFDGTRIKANNARDETATAPTLQKQVAELEAELAKRMAAWEAGDAEDERTFAPGETTTSLPEELALAQARLAHLQKALEKAQALDEARRRKGTDPQKSPAQAPLTDLDSQVMPNKDGGSAPNYTPTITVDAENGFLVDASVLGCVNEFNEVAPMVERVTETFGEAPQAVVADAGNAIGTTINEVEKQGVEYFTPVKSNQPQVGDIAYREDPRQPVAPEDWGKLPRNPKGKLDRSTFIYDPEQDVYYCPTGQTLEFSKSDSRQQTGGVVRSRVYQAAASTCASCPLVGACLSPQAKRGRTITRDEHEEARERTAARMATEAGQEIYSRRLHVGETPFAVMKSMFNLRQFLTRGLKRVETEWTWACTTYNVNKLLKRIGTLRAHLKGAPS